MIRVKVKPELLRWARERASVDGGELARKFPKYREWESGKTHPTLNQLERFANAVHLPFGSLFLSEPPHEPVPIPDFRTAGSPTPQRPSPDLFDVIYLCQQRQAWYRDFARMEGLPGLPFVGSATLESDVETVAAEIRGTLGFDLEKRCALPSRTAALRQFVDMAEEAGILVMISGVVGNNTHRKLNLDEFRSFSLADGLAPLVFINGRDAGPGQMFALAHCLAHLWLGQPALSDSCPASVPSHKVEVWCSKVAAELLVPLAALRGEYGKTEELFSELDRSAHRFKVSAAAVPGRLRDAGDISEKRFRKARDAEQAKPQSLKKGAGGNFYATQISRVGRRFARALVSSTLEGKTSFTESFQLLGLRKTETFDRLAGRLGVVP